MLSTRFVFNVNGPIHQYFNIIYTSRICEIYVKRIHFHKSLRYCIPVKNENKYITKDVIEDSTIKDDERFKVSLKSDLIEKVFYNKVDEWNTDKVDIKKPKVISLKDIEKLFPHPTSSVYNIYNTVNNELKKKDTLIVSWQQKHKNKNIYWTSTFNVVWPEEMDFTGVGTDKTSAAKIASLKCLLWLQSNKRIKGNKPILYTSNDAMKLYKRPVEVTVDSAFLPKIESLLEDYEKNIKHIITNSSKSDEFTSQLTNISTTNETDTKSFSTNILHARQESLQTRLLKRSFNKDYNLPIFKYREEILNQLKTNNILLIKGDTGCGKTTQVPQFILEQFIQEGKACDCNILVSQPRRISALSLAQRIANERGENVGDVIGYHIRLERILPKFPGGITFCTNGILCRILQTNFELKGYSHVILDEVHERTIDTDMLIVLLKKNLQINPSLKIIVMSATINAEMIQSYFNCSVVHVPGLTYPVKMHFLDDFKNFNIRNTDKGNEVDKYNASPTVDYNQVVHLLKWISQNKQKGAILCFLPGWSEISKLKLLLEQDIFFHNSSMIVPIHSKLSYIDQKRIFDTTPEGMRKIILATDIAETGITIADVVYVVDTAIRKVVTWDNYNGVSHFGNEWVSKANISQRKGRAGRVQPGESYHFITKEKYATLDEYPLAEVLRISLEKTILNIKTYSNETADEFLSNMMQPPNKKSVSRAVNVLIKLGALDHNENLTNLGKRIAYLAVHPALGKALVLSSIFQCVRPMLTIATSFSSDEDIFSNALDMKNAIRDVKSKFHISSDHLAISWIFLQWNLFNKRNMLEAQAFSKVSNLQYTKLKMLANVRNLIATQLVDSRIINASDICDNMEADENKFATRDELIEGIILTATNQLLQNKGMEFRDGIWKETNCSLRDQNDFKVTLTPESVNYKRKTWPSPYLTYLSQIYVKHRSRLVRETSVICPLTVLLFSPNCIETSKNIGEDEQENVVVCYNGNKNMQLSLKKELGDLLFPFHNVIWSVVEYFICNENVGTDEFQKVSEYKAEMIDTLSQMIRMVRTNATKHN